MSSNVKMLVGKNIKSLLTRDGMRQADLARMLRVSPATVTHWVSGQALPESPYVDAMVDKLGWRVAEIFSDFGEPAERTTVTPKVALEVLAKICGFQPPRLRPYPQTSKSKP